jgi:CBS-domain-containing membrane protein
MSSQAVAINATSRVVHAAGTMLSHGFTAWPRLDEDRRLVGIVTEADSLESRAKPEDQRRRAERQRHLRRGDTGGEVMTSPGHADPTVLAPGKVAAGAIPPGRTGR